MRGNLTNQAFLIHAVVRLVLLFIVLAEVTYLAAHYRVRIDLTGDQLYTLTSSTRKVLDKLEDRLLIEAYFSPRQNLPILHQPKRAALANLLEEYEKLGGGKVKVQFIDPLENKTRRETAERLGMMPLPGTADTWQGMRLRYGGRKQEVVPYLGFPPPGQHSTAFYERFLTPMIKQLTVVDRPKVGVLAFSSRPGGRGLSIIPERRTPPRHFSKIMRIFDPEYDMLAIDVSKGQLIPPDIKIALLIRPKYLSDRTKFVFDQFLMRGGKLVVFADTCEVEVREDRALRGTVVPYDAANAKYPFLDMLKSYGVEVRNQIVGEGFDGVQQTFYDVRQDQRTGRRDQHRILYPYMFEAANSDWHAVVDMMATGTNKVRDPVLLKLYREQVEPGMNTAHDLIKAIENIGAPGMFWPCPVALAAELPQGVTGEVLLRTSPLGWTEPPNMPLDPFDEAPQFQHREQNLKNWSHNKALMRPRAPRQIPLMVHLEGTFVSYFADKDVPASPIDQPEAKQDPDEEWGSEAKPKQSDALPKRPEPEKPEATAESKLILAPSDASLLVIGDATFIRDDFFLSGLYQPADSSHRRPIFGPHSRNPNGAVLFLKSLLDWMAQEYDLQALQFKHRTDRLMKFAEQKFAQQETFDEFRERIIVRSRWIRYANSLVPAFLLLLGGILVWFTRRAKKRAFLAGL